MQAVLEAMEEYDLKVKQGKEEAEARISDRDEQIQQLEEMLALAR